MHCGLITRPRIPLRTASARLGTMRRILLCCAVLTQALRLELDVDGGASTSSTKSRTLGGALATPRRSREARPAKYQGLGCEEVLYARHKCVASKIEEAMKAHRDQVADHAPVGLYCQGDRLTKC